MKRVQQAVYHLAEVFWGSDRGVMTPRLGVNRGRIG